MENDPYDSACRMGLLAVALLHWLMLALMVWNDAAVEATSHDSDIGVIEALASVFDAFVSVL